MFDSFFKYLGGGLNVFAQSQFSGNLPADSHVVAGDHLDLDAVLLGVGNGGRRVFARRIEQRQESQEFPGTVTAGAGHPQGAIALGRQLVHRLPWRVDVCSSGPAHVHDDLRCLW